MMIFLKVVVWEELPVELEGDHHLTPVDHVAHRQVGGVPALLVGGPAPADLPLEAGAVDAGTDHSVTLKADDTLEGALSRICAL